MDARPNDPTAPGLAALDELAAAAREARLPADERLAELAERLRRGEFHLMVVGEAKRGKSSLVNALLGRDLVPVGVEVATCRAFRLARAERERFAVRYADGSADEIAAGELARYGSQVEADAGRGPATARPVRWVEAEVPAAFLPPGVVLFDTPGLGALFAEHARVTESVLPLADGVAFVLRADEPVTGPELDFLETLANAGTRSVFFVLTGIDACRRAEWERVLARSEQKLRERLGGRLDELTVHPFSSRLLRRAADAGNDPDVVAASRYPELRAALEAFLFRAAGAARLAEAAARADAAHERGRHALAGRLAALREPAVSAAARQSARARRAEFEAKWGPSGAERRRLLRELGETAGRGKAAFLQGLAPAAPPFRDLRDRIAAAPDADAVRALAATLPAEVPARVQRLWDELTGQAQARCQELLAPFVREAEALLETPAFEAPGIARAGGPPDAASAGWERVRGAALGSGAMGAVTVLGLKVLAFGGGLVLAAPLATGVALAAGVWGLCQGWRSAAASQGKAARADATRDLEDILGQIRQYFTEASVAAECRADRAFRGLLERCERAVADTAASHLERLDAELRQLEADAALDAAERPARVAQAQEHLARWDAARPAVTAALDAARVALSNRQTGGPPCSTSSPSPWASTWAPPPSPPPAWTPRRAAPRPCCANPPPSASTPTAPPPPAPRPRAATPTARCAASSGCCPPPRRWRCPAGSSSRGTRSPSCWHTPAPGAARAQ